MIERRVEELRAAFARSFAEPEQKNTALTEDLLAIRVGGVACAIRLGEIAGLFADKKVAAIPTPIPELLGIAGFRGAVVAVYELGVVLGHPPAPDAPRWLVLTGGDGIALAFGALDGHLRVARSDILRDEGSTSRPFVREVVQCDGVSRPIIHLPSVLKALRERVKNNRPRSDER